MKTPSGIKGCLTRRQFLGDLALASAAVSLPRPALAAGSEVSPRAAGRSRPNIVLIMADDLGYECLGCYGSTSYLTPHLDALAGSGTRFTRCYSQPLCTPSRVQIMTGRYNHRNYTEFGALDPRETTFAHVLQQAGYATCVAGKWQLAARDLEVPGSYPEEAGFDEHCLWQVDRLESRYWDPLIQENGVYRTDLADRYGPDVFTDYILDFARRHVSEPFFVYYPMALTHGPFLPTPGSDPQADRLVSDPRHFADMVAHMDAVVGRIVDGLEQLGLRDDTLVLFTGDNGSPRQVTSRLGDRVLPGGKGQPTDAGTHVPLIANWPQTTPAGAVVDDLVDFSDFLPTFAQIAHARTPEAALDGHSFWPRLRGEMVHSREWVFCHYDPRKGRWERTRFVHDRHHKLYDDGRFYDLQADVVEAHPLAAGQLDDVASAARLRLQSVLDSML
ncbi:sulfatase-like hydrolase/transferase [Candidatus Latescibacterota bacterium]